MRPSVAAIARLVAGIVPGEQQEAEDVAETLRWLNGTDDVFRRVKPAIPDPHLVSYVVPVDPELSLRRDEGLRVDRGEFTTVRWWSADEIGVAGPATFDPALGRFITKLATRPDWPLPDG